MSSKFELNRRCKVQLEPKDDDKGKKQYAYAYIRYIGPVHVAKNQNTIYIGIEWDTPIGKHNDYIKR